MSLPRLLFLFAASLLAGGVNAVAGGGTLLSFPAAIAAGLPPIMANATNAVALVPGSFAAAYAYRRHLMGLGRMVAVLAVPGVAGALLGAMILRRTPQRLFDGIVPWLVLGATAIIFIQGIMARRAPAARPAEPPGMQPGGTAAGVAPTPPFPTAAPTTGGSPGGTVTRWPLLLALQLLVSIYGGYFGAAMGIVMLAFLGQLSAPETGERLSMHQMNAVKNVLAVVINGTASLDFLLHGLVRLDAALVMAAGAIAGGIIGGRLARRAQAHQVRLLIVAIGFGMAGLLAWRRYG